MASSFSRGIAITTAVLMAPLTIETLGLVNYGYWVLATQIPNMVVSPDLGLGQGTINDLAEAHRRDGHLRSQRRRLVGLAKLLKAVGALWFAIGVGAICAYAFASGADQQLWTVLILGLACFTAGIPSSIWTRAQLAQERGHESVWFEGGGKLLILILSPVTLWLAPNLGLLVVVSVLPTTLALAANARYVKKREGIAPSPDISLWDAFNENRGLFKTGGRFVALQVCFVAGVAVDPYLINAMQSAESVSYVNVLRRPFDALPLVLTLFTTSLWPVFSRLAVTDPGRLRRAVLLTTLAGAGGVVLCGIAIVLLRGPIYGFLGRGFLAVSTTDLIWLTTLTCSSTIVIVLTVLLNALADLKAQLLIVIPATFVTLVAKSIVLLNGNVHEYLAAAAMLHTLLIAVPLSAVAYVRLRSQRTGDRVSGLV
jgi:O-antigen/teichoic acid export membrane protein